MNISPLVRALRRLDRRRSREAPRAGRTVSSAMQELELGLVLTNVVRDSRDETRRGRRRLDAALPGRRDARAEQIGTPHRPGERRSRTVDLAMHAMSCRVGLRAARFLGKEPPKRLVRLHRDDAAHAVVREAAELRARDVERARAASA